MATCSASADSSASQSESSVSHKSDVWKYFSKDKDRKKATCQLCSKELAFKSGTTNLREHLMSKHCGTYKSQSTKCASKEKQGTLLQTFSKPKRCSNARAKEITDHIANFVALDMRPINAVEGEGFLRMMAYLEPGYKVPSRKHITSIIQQKHALGKQKLQEKLSEATSLALTTDIWTSAAAEAYITVLVILLLLTGTCARAFSRQPPFPIATREQQ